MSSTSIRRRLVINTVVVLCILGALTMLHYWTSGNLSRTFDYVERHEKAPEQEIRDMIELQNRMHTRLLATLLDGAGANDNGAREVEQDGARFAQHWRNFVSAHRLRNLDDGERELIARIAARVPNFQQLTEQLRDGYRNADRAALLRVAQTDWPPFEVSLMSPLRELATMQRTHAREAYGDLRDGFSRSAQLVGIVFFAGVLLVAILSCLLSRHINRRILGVETALQAVTAGDITATVPGDPGTEIGRIASAINYTLTMLRAEKAEIAELVRKNEAILGSISDGIYGVDSGGHIIFMNAAGCDLLHYAEHELIGKPSHQTLHHHYPDGRPYPAEECPLLLSRHAHATIHGDDQFLIRKDGTTFPIEYSCTPLLGSAHQGAAIVVFRDITERRARDNQLREAFEQLRQSNKELKATQSQLLQSEKMASIGQLAAGVAHEINNPVGFVNSNLGSLKNYVGQIFEVLDVYAKAEATLPDASDVRRELAEIKQRADLAYLREDIFDLLRESQDGLGRIKRIVADLKDFSHVGETDWQEADLNAGLESTLNVVWNELKYKAEVIRNFGALPPVRCLAAQLNQVFMNVLVNAAQAIETRGTITVSTCTEGDYAVVEITDTGKGIPPEVQQRIFEPFFTTKPVGKGTGLGLSIAWDIIKKHRGVISVSSSPGAGTRFRIRVPICGSESAPQDTLTDTLTAAAGEQAAIPEHSALSSITGATGTNSVHAAA